MELEWAEKVLLFFVLSVDLFSSLFSSLSLLIYYVPVWASGSSSGTSIFHPQILPARPITKDVHSATEE